MVNQVQGAVQAVLRESGLLTVDEIIARVPAALLSSSKNPKQTVRNALTSDRSIQSAGNSRYVYLPTFVRGASMRLSVDLAAPNRRLLAVGKEVLALLWPDDPWGGRGRSATLRLEGDEAVTVKPEHALSPGAGMWGAMQLPVPFWRWWDKQKRNGAVALLVTCEDGEAGRYAVRGIRTATLDPQAVAARNAQLREATAAVVKAARGVQTDHLGYRLLARGVYHGEPSPDPIVRTLFGPDGLFFVDGWTVTHRPELTPAMRRLFGYRLSTGALVEEEIIRESLGLPPLVKGEGEDEREIDHGDEVEAESAPEVPAQMGYRLKVSLGWKPGVWRIIEMLDNQTLEDLHYAIQDAFDWDDDHLYAFFLSDRAWDSITEVGRPGLGIHAEPPLADEVTLSEMELKAAQRFLYIFDFGDELRHEVQMVGTFSLPAKGEFPRIAESHGEAPPQYPGRNEEEEESV